MMVEDACYSSVALIYGTKVNVEVRRPVQSKDDRQQSHIISLL